MPKERQIFRRRYFMRAVKAVQDCGLAARLLDRTLYQHE